MNYKIWGSSAAAAAALAALTVIAFNVTSTPQDRYINLGVLVLGAMIGWVLGIVVTPYDRTESSRFAQVAKIVSVFLSGYLVAKIDPLVTRLLAPELILQPVNGARAVLLLGGLLSGLIVTFVFRTYAR